MWGMGLRGSFSMARDCRLRMVGMDLRDGLVGELLTFLLFFPRARGLNLCMNTG